MRVCVGRMLEVILGAGSKLRDNDDDGDDDDDDDDDQEYCVDEASPAFTSNVLFSSLPPPPSYPSSHVTRHHVRFCSFVICWDVSI